jgi:ABC-type phosphate transport system substrate-binding protein
MILNVLFQIVSSTCVLAKDIKIIVHSDVQDIISVNDIRNIFLGKKTQWTNNSRIRFVLLTEEQTYRTFIKHYIRKTLYQYRNYWRKKVFTGTGMMPIMYGSCDQCVDYVIRTKGAISFVPANYTVSDGVKEIILDY